MGKSSRDVQYYCDYCDVYLTHDSVSVRKAHNAGRNHLTNVRDYYSSLGGDKAQDMIDQITRQFESGGAPRGPGGMRQFGGMPPPMSGPPPFTFGPGPMMGGPGGPPRMGIGMGGGPPPQFGGMPPPPGMGPMGPGMSMPMSMAPGVPPMGMPMPGSAPPPMMAPPRPQAGAPPGGEGAKLTAGGLHPDRARALGLL